jgi:hypothetical protein
VSEDILGPVHAGIRLERQSAESRQDGHAAPAARFIPGEIHAQSHYGDRAQREKHADSSGRRECAHPEERRHRREWDAELLSDHQGA